MKLKGHSKFKLKFIKNGQNYIVQKSANGEILKLRLKKQMEKQKVFYWLLKSEKLIKLFFEVPKVLEEKEYLKSYQAKMSFYRGKSIIDIIEKGDIFILDNILEKLFLFLEWECQHCEYKFLDLKKIYKKLDSLASKTKEIKITTRLKKAFSKYNQTIIPIGICHGDFTFSNMIFSNKIVLIDFLDSYIETPLQDLSKLLQEVNLKWSALMTYKKNDNEKISIAYNFIQKKVQEKLEGFFVKMNLDKNLINLFYQLTLLRILPYTTNKNIYKLIKGEIQKCLP